MVRLIRLYADPRSWCMHIYSGTYSNGLEFSTRARPEWHCWWEEKGCIYISGAWTGLYFRKIRKEEKGKPIRLNVLNIWVHHGFNFTHVYRHRCAAHRSWTSVRPPRCWFELCDISQLLENSVASRMKLSMGPISNSIRIGNHKHIILFRTVLLERFACPRKESKSEQFSTDGGLSRGRSFTQTDLK